MKLRDLDIPALDAHSDEAEADVIAACLFHDAAIDDADLEPGDFWHDRRRVIWAAMQELRAKKAPVTPATLEAELGRSGRLEAVGGLPYLSELMRSARVAHVQHHAAIVREHSRQRQVAQTLLAIAQQRDATADERIEAAHDALLALDSRKPEASVSIGELADDVLRDVATQIKAIQDGKPIAVGLTTGLPDLDWGLAGGIEFGGTLVLGGRPSDGKSSLARTFVFEAVTKGWPAIVFSLEDPRKAYGRRVFADMTRIDLAKLRRGELDGGAEGDEAQRIYHAHRRLKAYGGLWRIDDARGSTMPQIARKVRRWRRRMDPDRKGMLVVLDFLQLLRGKERDRRAVIEANMNDFADLCGNEGVAGVLLSQLNRSNARENRRPELHDLRETGEIEQSATAVIFVHHDKEWVNDRATIKSSVIIVAKNKNGPRNLDVAVYFDEPTATFRPVDWRVRPAPLALDPRTGRD